MEGPPSSIDIASVITTTTIILQYIIFLLWLRITIYFLGDILNFCQYITTIVTRVVDSIVGGRRATRRADQGQVGAVGARRICLW